MTKPVISVIAAIGKNRELGKDNKLLWHIPEDLQRFKRLTSGHTVIMGRKTFESIGRPLPNRLNIVITRDPNFKPDGVNICHSLAEALEASIKYKVSSIKQEKKKNILNTKYSIPDTEDEVFIIGGGQIFEQAMPIVDRLYLTIVDATFDADVYFPDYSEFKKITFEEVGESGRYRYKFINREK
ncbi:MAG: dihydrofolate reductase [Candidatus Levybacteria bacterium]|nr:dihydrofolate reductase [Candidatus Levybacteria bacterium]